MIKKYKLPDFLQNQRSNYSSFLEKGISEEVKIIGPIKSARGSLAFQFDPKTVRFQKPKISPEVCSFSGKTYAVSLYINADLFFRPEKLPEKQNTIDASGLASACYSAEPPRATPEHSPRFARSKAHRRERRVLHQGTKIYANGNSPFDHAIGGSTTRQSQEKFQKAQVISSATSAEARLDEILGPGPEAKSANASLREKRWSSARRSRASCTSGQGPSISSSSTTSISSSLSAAPSRSGRSMCSSLGSFEPSSNASREARLGSERPEGPSRRRTTENPWDLGKNGVAQNRAFRISRREIDLPPPRSAFILGKNYSKLLLKIITKKEALVSLNTSSLFRKAKELAPMASVLPPRGNTSTTANDPRQWRSATRLMKYSSSTTRCIASREARHHHDAAQTQKASNVVYEVLITERKNTALASVLPRRGNTSTTAKVIGKKKPIFIGKVILVRASVPKGHSNLASREAKHLDEYYINGSPKTSHRYASPISAPRFARSEAQRALKAKKGVGAPVGTGRPLGSRFDGETLEEGEALRACALEMVVVPRPTGHDDVLRFSRSEASRLKKRCATLPRVNGLAKRGRKVQKNHSSQQVCLGEIPLMADRGTFVVNGTRRVVVSQIIRCPGVYYKVLFDNEKNRTYVASIIPNYGSWLRLEIDTEGLIWAELDKMRKIPILIFLQALGLTHAKIVSYFQDTVARGNGDLSSEDLEFLKEPLSPREALKRLNLSLKSGAILNSGQTFLLSRFQDPRNYDLSEIGRRQLNKKLSLNVPKVCRILRPEDVLAALNYLICLKKGLGSVDDIDDLKNRRVRPPGELVQNQLRTGLGRLERLIRYNLSLCEKKLSNSEKLNDVVLAPSSFINPKPMAAPLKEFFGLSPLSQYMDQTNPLAEMTHKRRISSLGPGGINKERAGLEVRDIHPSYYGRICPIETLEGDKAGLVGSLTTYGKINKYGVLESPFYKVRTKEVQLNLGLFFLSAEQESKVVVSSGDLLWYSASPSSSAAPSSTSSSSLRSPQTGLSANAPSGGPREARLMLGPRRERRVFHHSPRRAPLRAERVAPALRPRSTKWFLADNGTEIPVRCHHEYNPGQPAEVDYTAISPIQMISVATSLIPFLEHDDANRALMGSNMQRQAVPLIKPERPIVGTGLEGQAARDSGGVVIARKSGLVEFVSSEKIRLTEVGSLGDLNDSFTSSLRSSTSSSGQGATLLAKRGPSSDAPSAMMKYSSSTTRCNSLCSFEQSSNASREAKLLGASPSKKTTYFLQKYKRSNQETCINQTPTVYEGEWVPKGNLLADGTATVDGELALGQNILVAYMPWEGYNFEDAVLISQRLVSENVYTSIHIQRFETETQQTKYGFETITKNIPNVNPYFLRHLDKNGIIKEGSWVEPGDILVGKITPKDELEPTPEIRLLCAIFGQKPHDIVSSSLKVPTGVKGRIVRIEVFKKDVGGDLSTPFDDGDAPSSFAPSVTPSACVEVPERELNQSEYLGLASPEVLGEAKAGEAKAPPIYQNEINLAKRSTSAQAEGVTLGAKLLGASPSKKTPDFASKFISNFDGVLPDRVELRVYLAQMRRIQVGDKISGRHGNKGIVSNIIPREDMPFLQDGTPIDMVLNPLGVPSRMNVGQVFETLLGLAGKYLKQNYKIVPFDEMYGKEASRGFVYSKLFEAKNKTKKSWLFDPYSPGKTRVFDGRTGEPFYEPVTVGYAYMLKLVHQVDDKIHARCTGPYSLVTQQPLRGRSKHGGQRLGEMEVWALEGFGAAYTLQELLTLKSDDMKGRNKTLTAIIRGYSIPIPGTPESFKVLIRELQALCLDMILQRQGKEVTF